jgi:hypothetical protein
MTILLYGGALHFSHYVKRFLGIIVRVLRLEVSVWIY